MIKNRWRFMKFVCAFCTQQPWLFPGDTVVPGKLFCWLTKARCLTWLLPSLFAGVCKPYLPSIILCFVFSEANQQVFFPSCCTCTFFGIWTYGQFFTIENYSFVRIKKKKKKKKTLDSTCFALSSHFWRTLFLSRITCQWEFFAERWVPLWFYGVNRVSDLLGWKSLIV